MRIEARILVIDDNDDTAFLLAKLLESQGFETEICNSGKAALAALQKSAHPDLIICDVMMPGIDGYEVLRTIRTDSQLRYIPLILLTANDEVGDVVQRNSRRLGGS